ncbi:MAG: ribosomal protein bacterial type [Ignavibacteria bacterium]|nr:ribosomal protein bacterial type [Ignavibacteria bacterium]
MKTLEIKKARRTRRKLHVRKKLDYKPNVIRLTVTRTLNHIYAQIISDVDQKTLVSASTVDKEIRPMIKPGMKKIEKSKLVGAQIAKRAIENNIKKITFDRNGFLYHGRVKALADAAREGGLEF